jgi:Putative Ig domain/Galactose oxidase, central domain/Kelch motif
MKRSLLVLISASSLCLLAACGSGSPPPPATHFSVTALATASAGTAVSFTVTALDTSNRATTNYSGTAHFTSTDGQATLPANAMLMNGTGTFSATLKTAGSQTITATDTVTATITGTSNSINVGSGPASHFSVVAPATTTAGTPLNFMVTALDASSNQVTSYTGTVRFSSTDGQAVLPASSTLTDGTGRFSATLKTSGNQTITVVDIAAISISGTSGAISVNSVVSILSITSGAPPNGTAGSVYDKTTVPCMPGTYRCDCIFLPGLNPICSRQTFGFTMMAVGGTPPYDWAVTGLPPGLSLSGATIAGTPPAGSEGIYKVLVTVLDAATPANRETANYSISIVPPPPPQIVTVPAPYSPTVNQPYTFTFTAEGGAQPLTWSEAGTLPAGIAFSTSGVLSGETTGTGSFPITVVTQDSAGQNSAPFNFDLQVFVHGFTPTGGMSAPRALHTAAQLNDGRVLIAGGTDERGNNSQTGEIYDPTSGTFTATGNMNTARSSHTATTLPSGIVLITGGGSATAELFDPKSGTFTNSGSLPANCYASTGTLLNDGTVLVTGGSCPDGNSSAAELFDPTTGTFTATGDMVSARSGHTATLLQNGKVLVTGGMDVQGQPLTTAELFDPSAGTFSLTGNMSVARYGHTATLLCNLSSGTCNNPKVLVAGDGTTAELFDPTSGDFSVTGSMASARQLNTATLLNDGTVLVAGPDQSAELYDPTSGTFSATGTMTVARESQTATKLNDGTVLLTGGATINADSTVVALKSAEIYNP